jgi:predicted molibdopterin-dependent oxidoreductase YjgC
VLPTPPTSKGQTFVNKKGRVQRIRARFRRSPIRREDWAFFSKSPGGEHPSHS